MKRVFFVTGVSFVFGALLLLSVAVSAGPASQSDETEDLFADPVKRGEYLAYVSGCIDCHTPLREEFEADELDTEQLQTLAFNRRDALDEAMWMAGNRWFNLGPAGRIRSTNITPHAETGLGERTDEEIKAMIQLGLSRRDHQLFPLMPYQHYNTMAEDDLDALVAYLRSIEPIDFETPHPDVEEHHLGERPHIDPPEDPLAEAPAPTDIEARGDYLFNSVLLCTNCHTPRNPDTGQPDPELYLSGGQPFEGAWGIVYGGNITPHDDTGIGSWSDEDIKRVLAEGIRPDGRRVVVMPSSYLSVLTEEDLDAIVYYLRNVVEPVQREIPAGSLQEGFFEEFVDFSD